MICPRCESKTQIVIEYYNVNEESFIRDRFCGNCNSAIVETFRSDSSYKSEWIDLNV